MLTTPDDSRRRTQVRGIMKTANRSYTPQEQERIEDDINEEL